MAQNMIGIEAGRILGTDGQWTSNPTPSDRAVQVARSLYEERYTLWRAACKKAEQAGQKSETCRFVSETRARLERASARWHAAHARACRENARRRAKAVA